MRGDVAFTPEDLIDHHAVAAVFTDERGQVLVMHHSKWGFWTVPIGKAHSGQSPLDGLKEEMADELDVTVLEADDTYQDEIEYIRDGHPVRLVMHVFEVKRYEGTITNLEPEKHPELRFMPIEELACQESLSDATLLFLEGRGVPASAKWSARRIGDS